jgi:hypothetical protein
MLKNRSANVALQRWSAGAVTLLAHLLLLALLELEPPEPVLDQFGLASGDSSGVG